MRVIFLLVLVGTLMVTVLACRAEDPDPEALEQETPLSPAPSPTVTATPVATVIAEPTPSTVTLTIWGPIEFAPDGPNDGARVFGEQVEAFHLAHPDIHVEYQPKAPEGTAGVLNYLRSASAVAPSVVPDLVIIPMAAMEEGSRTGLFYPLDSVVDDDLREDLYPFATRDTAVESRWLGLPLAVQVEHGVTRTANREGIPSRLEALTGEEAPLLLFAGQAVRDGEISNALLLQLLAVSEGLPGPGMLPERQQLVDLFTVLQDAQKQGRIPRQILSLEESEDLFTRLLNDQADLIGTNSRRFLSERSGTARITFAPIPTLNGEVTTVIDGYLIALTTDDPRDQEAVATLLRWLLESERLAEWSQASHWLPARRTALRKAVSDSSYFTFLNERLENGWLRPSDATWIGFAQLMQEQFRAVMTEQASPDEAVEIIFQSYPPN